MFCVIIFCTSTINGEFMSRTRFVPKFDKILIICSKRGLSFPNPNGKQSTIYIFFSRNKVKYLKRTKSCFHFSPDKRSVQFYGHFLNSPGNKTAGRYKIFTFPLLLSSFLPPNFRELDIHQNNYLRSLSIHQTSHSVVFSFRFLRAFLQKNLSIEACKK